MHSLDAPVSGGDVGARNATLSIMVGGDEEAFEAVLPCLQAMGTTAVRHGGPGTGQHTKLVNQMLVAGTIVAVCEALVYAHRAGLDLELVLASVSAGAAGSWALSNLAPRMLAGNDAPGFLVDHFVKDMALALAEARRMQLSLPGLALAQQLYVALQAQGRGHDGTQCARPRGGVAVGHRLVDAGGHLVTATAPPTPTRERILDAAWRLFAQQGFAGTTVSQIEAASSLAAGSGSFYRHFRSKEEVLHAVVDREVERADAARDVGPEPADTGGDVRVALAMEFQRRLASLRRLHPLIRVVQREREHLGTSRDHLGDLLVSRNVTVRSERFAAWMARGAIPTRDPEALATAVMCALVGYDMSCEYFGRPPGGTSEEAFISTLVSFVAGA